MRRALSRREREPGVGRALSAAAPGARAAVQPGRRAQPAGGGTVWRALARRQWLRPAQPPANQRNAGLVTSPPIGDITPSSMRTRDPFLLATCCDDAILRCCLSSGRRSDQEDLKTKLNTQSESWSAAGAARPSLAGKVEILPMTRPMGRRRGGKRRGSTQQKENRRRRKEKKTKG